MGIFSNLKKEPVVIEKFYKFVSGMTKKELLDAVTEEYYKLKGTSNLSPYMGTNGSFEFAGALLLWRYANKQLKASGKEINTYGSLLVSLAETIGCAFNHMPPLEWSDKIDVVINSYDDVLTYAEWSKVYRYLNDNYSTQLHQFEFNTITMIQQLEYDRLYPRFTVLYNSLPNFKSVIDYYSSQGLGFKKDIWFRIDN